MSVKVRYGRTEQEQVRKNTLVTIRKDNVLYFGIARCNLGGDIPDKNFGKNLATKRAEVAIGDEWNIHTSNGSFHLHKFGLLGSVCVDERSKLFEYFANIDSILKEKNRQ